MECDKDASCLLLDFFGEFELKLAPPAISEFFVSVFSIAFFDSKDSKVFTGGNWCKVVDW